MRIWIKLPGLKGKTSGSAMLEAHLKGHGFQIWRRKTPPKGLRVDKVVTYGSSYHGPLPALNANVGAYDKMIALERFINAGLNAPMPRLTTNLYKDGTVALLRNKHHHEGRDIIVCKNRQELEAHKHEREYFVEWIPTAAEYRAWVFKDKLLAIYEKQFKEEGKFDGFARNNRFGFEFVNRKEDGVKDIQRLKEASVGAIKALRLDWGAVDVIRGKDGKHYVLEVNTAPAINGLDRKSGIELAKCVREWANV